MTARRVERADGVYVGFLWSMLNSLGRREWHAGTEKTR